MGAVAGVRLDEGCGDLPANILGQHRVQPDMRIAALVKVGRFFFFMMPAGMARFLGFLMVVLMGVLEQGDALGCFHHHQAVASPGAQQLVRPGFQAGADIDEHPGLGGPGHHRRGRFKGVGAGARGDQHLDLDQIAADFLAKVAQGHNGGGHQELAGGGRGPGRADQERQTPDSQTELAG